MMLLPKLMIILHKLLMTVIYLTFLMMAPIILISMMMILNQCYKLLSFFIIDLKNMKCYDDDAE